jgi:DNA-binding CsgD family transcriptional regulator
MVPVEAGTSSLAPLGIAHGQGLRRGTGNRPPTAADAAAAIARKQRRARVIELRSQAASLKYIANELGISIRTVKYDIRRGFDELGNEKGEEARAPLNAQHDADLVRLAGVIRAILPLAAPEKGKPDLKAANALANLTRAKTRIAVAKATLNCANLVPPRAQLDVKVEDKVSLVSIEEALRAADDNARDVAAECPWPISQGPAYVSVEEAKRIARENAGIGLPFDGDDRKKEPRALLLSG